MPKKIPINPLDAANPDIPGPNTPEDYIASSMATQLKQKLVDYFCKPISNKYKRLSSNQNELTFNMFFQICPDEDLKERIRQITVEEYYNRVFINGENIIGPKFDVGFKRVITFDQIINAKTIKGKEGFNDSSYVQKLREYAKNGFITHFLKKYHSGSTVMLGKKTRRNQQEQDRSSIISSYSNDSSS